MKILDVFIYKSIPKMGPSDIVDHFIINEELQILIKTNSNYIELKIDEGFMFDGYSIPNILKDTFKPLTEISYIPALVHDVLCAHQYKDHEYGTKLFKGLLDFYIKPKPWYVKVTLKVLEFLMIKGLNSKEGKRVYNEFSFKDKELKAFSNIILKD